MPYLFQQFVDAVIDFYCDVLTELDINGYHRKRPVPVPVR
jgi:hypothetical protein